MIDPMFSEFTRASTKVAGEPAHLPSSLPPNHVCASVLALVSDAPTLASPPNLLLHPLPLRQGREPRKEREVAALLARNDFTRIAAPALAIYAQFHSAEQFYDGFAGFDAESQALARHAFAVWTGWVSGVRSRFRNEVQRPTVVLLPGAHHYLFISHPDEVERTMRDFLARAGS